jgi:RNA polymerase sigma-70 factor (ECF subfamily)
VEDVFLKIWSRRKTLDQVTNLKLYLYIATRNFSINYCKLNKRNEHFDPYNLKIELKDIAPDPHQQLLNAELAKLINETVNNLPPNCKVIYKLVKEDGLRHKEVAEILHLSSKTVENQLAIAVKRMALAIGREKKASEKKI